MGRSGEEDEGSGSAPARGEACERVAGGAGRPARGGGGKPAGTQPRGGGGGGRGRPVGARLDPGPAPRRAFPPPPGGGGGRPGGARERAPAATWPGPASSTCTASPA